ncbi:unnamed protein product [Diabrotica balteata]|uniref:Chitin-binding type-2 domain-containing protein n=1 Tax=Diabrotica balteata TaxID=107213 RepID=A0A9N9T605_DIABA|nr:unnamed protein product [Diabrotica balteata]
MVPVLILLFFCVSVKSGLANVECPKVDGPDSVYFPHEDCSKFYQCSNGVPYVHNCSSGLHFNSKLNVCDYPFAAGCEGEIVNPSSDDNGDQNSCLLESFLCPAVDGPDSVYFPLSDCSKFCQCSNGVPYEHSCPDGLHFNPKLNVCDWPQNAGCGGSDIVTDPTVTPTQDSGNSTNPTPAPNACQKEGVVCPAVDGPDSVYFPLSDCSKFCQCSNGVPYEHSCPDGLHFNPKLNVCDWPQNAGCGGSDIVTDPTVTPTQDSGNNTNPTPAPNACQKEGVVCPAVDGPDSVYFPLSDCSKFCQCSNGVPYEHSCPDGLHFNPKLNVCDWPQNAGCGGSDIVTDPTVTPTQDSGNNTNPTPAPNACQKEGVVCPAVDGPDSIYFPLSDCSKFCQCSNGVPYEHSCPDGLHFNPKLNVCDWPQNAGCGGSDIVTDPTVSPTQDSGNNTNPTPAPNACQKEGVGSDIVTDPTVTPTQDSGNNTNPTPAPNACQKEGVVCPAVDGPDSVYFPLSDCSKFCQCSNGVPYEHSCPDGLHFNPKLNVCDWPQNAGCGGSDIVTDPTVTPTQDSGNNTNPTPAPNACQKEGVVCPAVDGPDSIYFPLSDCSKFCQCSNGVPYEHSCPDGLHFNPKLNVCDWPQNAGCGGSDIVTDPTVSPTQDSGNNTNPTPAPNACQKEGVVCPAVDGPDSVYFPLSDCSKFCQCSNGVPYEHSCPDGLHFNPKLNVCDWPQNAGCGGSDIVTDPTVTPTQDSGNNTNPTPAPNACQKEGVVCPAVDGPDSIYFPLSDCSKFCQCSNGVPYEHSCPDGLHFNPKLNVCDWPQNAGCGGSDIVTDPTVSPTQDSGNNTNPTPAPNACQKEGVVCPAVDGPDSVYFPLSDCSKFCQCSNGVPYEHSCPDGLHFNPKLNVCDWPQNAGCGGSDIVTDPTVTPTQDSGNNTNPTPAPNACQKEGVVCPAVDGPDSVYFPLSDCSKFCQCSNGVPYEHSCPDGLHFNPKLNVCDWPQNAGCGGSDIVTDPTVTPTQDSGNNTNPTPAPNACQKEGVVCPAVDGPDSIYFPLSDCSKFCQCSNGVPYEHSCPDGLHFNPKLNVCDWPQNAGCGGSDIVTDPTVTPTQDSGNNTNPTPAPNACQKEGVVCPAVDGPDSVYFPLSDCSKFCQCSNGVPYEHSCPDGLHFNPKLNVCDWPQNAGCGGSDIVTDPTVTPTQDSGNNTNPTPAPNACQKEGVVCPAVDGPDSVYFPLSDCSKFCQCSNGVPYEHSCPDGLHFNPKLNVCDWPQNAGCGGSDIVTDPTVTPTQDSGNNTNPTPAPNACQKEGVVCPAVDGPDSVYFPLSDCSKFCQCSNGVPYEHSCPDGLHFNPKLNVCDWPQNAGCGGSDIVTDPTVTPTQDSGNNTNPTPAPNACQKEGVVCPAVDGPDSVYFPLSDCSKFCQCSNGVPYEHSCPDGLHFNPKLNVCDWPQNAGCGGSDIVTDPTVTPTQDSGNNTNPTPAPNACQKEGVVCPAVDGPDSIYFPLSDCSKFCQCSNGVPYEHSCPDGLHFNPKLNVCDWPQNAGCGGSDIVTDPTVSPTQDSGNNTNPTPAPNACQKEGVVCPAVDGPDSVYFPLSDCSKFCQCSNGVPYEHSCPDGLHFNPKLNVCDWPQNAGCGGSDIVTDPTVTPTQDSGNNTNPTPAPNACQKEGVVCPAVDGPDSVYFPLSDCSKFCQCSNGVPYEHSCPDGLHFNPKLNVCDWPQNAGCGGSDIVTDPTVTPTNNDDCDPGPVVPKPNSCQKEGVVCPAIDGPDSVYFALRNCSKFCQCSNGVPYEHTCPGSLHFNPTLNVCDWPDHAGCKTAT